VKSSKKATTTVNVPKKKEDKDISGLMGPRKKKKGT